MKKSHFVVAVVFGLVVATSAQARDSFNIGVVIGGNGFAQPDIDFAPPPVMFYPAPTHSYPAPARAYYFAPVPVVDSNNFNGGHSLHHEGGQYYRNHGGRSLQHEGGDYYNDRGRRGRSSQDHD
jgi:hypothetical protein